MTLDEAEALVPGQDYVKVYWSGLDLWDAELFLGLAYEENELVIITGDRMSQWSHYLQNVRGIKNG